MDQFNCILDSGSKSVISLSELHYDPSLALSWQLEQHEQQLRTLQLSLAGKWSPAAAAALEQLEGECCSLSLQLDYYETHHIPTLLSNIQEEISNEKENSSQVEMLQRRTDALKMEQLLLDRKFPWKSRLFLAHQIADVRSVYLLALWVFGEREREGEESGRLG